MDKNPRAVDLARLSLWLATLAKDHEFTFLDHALKCGDSLVGLTTAQITATHWDTLKPPTFVGKLVNDHLRDAEELRAQIRSEAEWATEAELRPLLRRADAKLAAARFIGDGVIAAFFSADKPSKRIETLVEFQKLVLSHINSTRWSEHLLPFTTNLASGKRSIKPFHWQIEFPEAFARENAGFDAIIGNPPFLGGSKVSSNFGKSYLDWLLTVHPNSHGNADLVAHFFRRAFVLLGKKGNSGLIATNTIGQGDTRGTGLTALIRQGGRIYRVARRLKWPGEAAVVVSVIHFGKSSTDVSILDEKIVHRISAYLVEGDYDDTPAHLISNRRRAFNGTKIYGAGFTFDDKEAAKGNATDLATMNALLAQNPANQERIFRYVGGEDLNVRIDHSSERFVIDFGNMSEEHSRSHWPDLMTVVENKVKTSRGELQAPWWQFERRRAELYESSKQLVRVLAICRHTPHLAFSFLQTGCVFADSLVILTFSKCAPFAALQSRVHELWARFFSSSMKDDLRYTPSDCFITFAFPENFEHDAILEIAGEAYHTSRAELMIARNEGLTKTYNRFHARGENAADIRRLRELHHEMDKAVLRAYGWHDLAEHAAPEFIEQDADEGKTPKTRLDWPAEFKDEVLARLLTLNAQRAAAERAAGLIVEPDGEEQEDLELAPDI